LEGFGVENVGILSGHGDILQLYEIGILWQFGDFVVIWYIFPHFGILYQDKSGNPGVKAFARIDLKRMLSRKLKRNRNHSKYFNSKLVSSEKRSWRCATAQFFEVD
jgi:hypothetical protein